MRLSLPLVRCPVCGRSVYAISADDLHMHAHRNPDGDICYESLGVQGEPLPAEAAP